MGAFSIQHSRDIPWSSLGPLLGIFGLWIFGLIIYAIRTAIKGKFISHRVQEMGGTKLLNEWTMSYGYWVLNGIGKSCVWLGISPNMVTSLSLVVALTSALVLYMGFFGLGGWLMILAALLDVLDGMVARESGVASDAGEFFDSIVDRYCELLSFIAVMGYYFSFQPIVAVIVGFAMVASIMITFNRAKGEAQGISGVPSGLMRRHERLLYIGVGTAASPIVAYWVEPGAMQPMFHLAIVAYALVAVIGNITAIRLAIEIHRRLRARDAALQPQALAAIPSQDVPVAAIES